MENLTNIIEAILFAAGNGVAISDIAEKLSVTEKEISASLKELKAKYGEEGGIQLLEFNKKAQLCSNPAYKEEVASVLNSIREKELTKTILECAAIIAYKQPITRTEVELLRGSNSDYAIGKLLELKLIAACGRKDAVGRPVLYATTDEFLKRFKLSSLQELPDYDELMADLVHPEAERDSYLYARKEYKDPSVAQGELPSRAEEKKQAEVPKVQEEVAFADGGYEIPDFLRGTDDSDIVKIS